MDAEKKESGANLTVRLEYEVSTPYSTWKSLLGFILQNGRYEVMGEVKIRYQRMW
ncbi:hypothetical protein [Geoglobus acetivorans]|uniref:Uncharacterized protein n=1 Tax=Geoglobus acetivorans TaxID=565033 RepID=A0ABZ3H6D7_GEOAI|nr:hypothetical protein [Geoglobus acetivorans]